IILCDFGRMTFGEQQTVTVTASLTEDRTLNNRHSVTSGSLDPDPVNNVVYLAIPVPSTVDTERLEDPEDRGEAVPGEFRLHPGYPNPFSLTTTIRYDIPTSSHVRIDLIDVLGRTVRTLVDASRAPGSYAVSLDGRDLPAGTYFYRIESGGFTDTKRMVLLK
ncbi:MAG: T9SS type A sorting domain-containing protein, partial [Rhodothermales bacterium]|nr:T9SS type A sorting domain-containing protein [Rhodothermales bacterium]